MTKLLAVANCEIGGKTKILQSSLAFLPKPRKKKINKSKVNSWLNCKNFDTFYYLISKTLFTYFRSILSNPHLYCLQLNASSGISSVAP